MGTPTNYCLEIRKSTGTYVGTCEYSGTAKTFLVPVASLTNTNVGYAPSNAVTIRVNATVSGVVYSGISTSAAPNNLMDVSWSNLSAPTLTNATNSITLTWVPIATPTVADTGNTGSISSYLVEYKVSTGSTWTTLSNASSATKTYTNAVPSSIFMYATTYNVRVSVMNTCGQGKFPSPSLTFTTAGSVPTVTPTGLTNSVLNGTMI